MKYAAGKSPIAIARFIDAWGSMGSLLGFNPSTARVHALLIATREPLPLDEIAARLQISRGNASMCLKELRSWGVIHRAPAPGDRRNHYTSESDVWKMALSIAGERKRRDFDPALRGVREALSQIEPGASGVAAERIGQMEDFLSTLDAFGRNILDNDAAAMSLLTLIRGVLSTPER
jgi:DNA-binding transcriptional regulator GbsR (MarR family)